MRMSMEKIIDTMGNTTHFKVKKNDRTCMRLDKEQLFEEMSKIKAGCKAQAHNGFLSRILGFITKRKSD